MDKQTILEERIRKAEDLLFRCYDVMDDVHLDGTDLHDEIGKFIDGEEE